MKRSARICVERLEGRDLPATFLVPWADSENVTLSFAPDGTDVEGQGSLLFQSLSVAARPRVWQGQAYRALQAWLATADIGVGVVADSGDPFGAPGLIQGDPRFGDIRIGARPLSDNVIAITTPSGFFGGTRGGDIILNSNVSFAFGEANGAYDLYTVLLQEFGHALGMANSTSPESAMYSAYRGPRTGLSPGDLENIKALYGIRSADPLEGPNGNDWPHHAHRLQQSSDVDEVLKARGDIRSSNDLDFFDFTATSTFLAVDVRTAGLSLLLPGVVVYDVDFNQVAATPLGDHSTGLLTLSLDTAIVGEKYYVAVWAAPGSPFAAGAYHLTVALKPTRYDPDQRTEGEKPPTPILGDASDDVENALPLATWGSANNSYRYIADLATTTDVDIYRVRTPAFSEGQAGTITVSTTAMNAPALTATVVVLNAYFLPVAATVLVNEQGQFSVQVENASQNSHYYLIVRGAQHAGTAATGGYALQVRYGLPAVALQNLPSGSISEAARDDFSTLTVTRSGVVRLAFTVSNSFPEVQAGATLTVYDEQHRIVANWFARSDESITGSVFLNPGLYIIRVHGITQSLFDLLPLLNYTLRATTLTDPIGPAPSDPNDPGYTWEDVENSLYAALGLLDPTDVVVW